MKRIQRSAIVAHGAPELYALVQDIESYPRFLPWCLEARVLEKGAFTKARITAGMRGLRQSFTTLNENHAAESIDMRLVEGPFRHFVAAWRFTPLSAEACRIDFSLEHEFASRTLAKLLEPLFDRIADTMVDAFARRADEVYGHHG
ncbi:MAG: type II toxin-antitoxin system RatA family toxin [Betaproteobacteria bacterium]|nr:type II toxin-antitoxin system RatA family toxin [Betaproteobacteria bacterium]